MQKDPMNTTARFDSSSRRRTHAKPTSQNAGAETLVSRRGFLYGAVGAAAAAVAGTAFGVTQCSKAPSTEVIDEDAPAQALVTGDIETLAVPSAAVYTTEDCEYIENIDESVSLLGQVSLPYGTLVWADDSTVAACLIPCETSSPLTQVGILSLLSGNVNKVLAAAIGADEGFEIYDVRANSNGIIWTEADILDGQWRIYTAPLKDMEMGTPALAAQGDSDWETPSLAVSGDFGFWQLMPNPSGPMKREKSLLMRIAFGADESAAKAVFESAGRMACDPATTSTGIAFAPRVDTSGVYYQLTHIDADSGQVTDTMVLPASMKPSHIGYGESGFSFSFDAIYNYGDGIANLGTYTATGGETPEGSEWFRFPRTPLTAPSWSKGWFVVKSTSVVAGIDFANKRYFTMSPENATQGYGEFLASSGMQDRFVTYSNIDYTPLDGNRINECNVRIWEFV